MLRPMRFDATFSKANWTVKKTNREICGTRFSAQVIRKDFRAPFSDRSGRSAPSEVTSLKLKLLSTMHNQISKGGRHYSRQMIVQISDKKSPVR